jgi:large subunit ribosomal protein L30
MVNQKTITLKQVKSVIGRPKDQEATLKGLGLNKMNRISTIIDTPENRGMVNKVAHLIEILEN